MNFTRQEVVNKICNKQTTNKSQNNKSKLESNWHFAPINIALIKYWGKRNDELKLPMSSSLSITSINLGSRAKIVKQPADNKTTQTNGDIVIFNGKIANNDFSNRVLEFFNLFKKALKIDDTFTIYTENNIPMASGFASSASGFASLSKAINDIFDFRLSNTELSIIARLGSGSACRSVFDSDIKYVKWQKGQNDDGMDSYSSPFSFSNATQTTADNAAILLLVLSNQSKPVSSTAAMKLTMQLKNGEITNQKYLSWLRQTENDIQQIENVKTFAEFGEIVERNSLMMHESIRAIGIDYFSSRTHKVLEFIQTHRPQLKAYATIDAGANVALLTQKNDIDNLKQSLLSANLVDESEILEF